MFGKYFVTLQRKSKYKSELQESMKFVSWNVNGLRACEGKGFSDIFKQLDADFFCLQETKMQEGQLDSSTSPLRAMTVIGTMPTRKATAARLSSLSINR